MPKVSTSRTHTIAVCGLSIALLTASAWITVPIGPVPFTLQTLMLVFLVLVLSPRQALISVMGYLALGAIGAPIFSGMKGGLVSLMGPTGGFLIGFGVGTCLALTVLQVMKPQTTSHEYLRLICASIVLVGTSYVCGWAQLMAVAHLSPLAAFMTGIAPFIILDTIKSAVAIKLAHSVSAVVPWLQTEHSA